MFVKIDYALIAKNMSNWNETGVEGREDFYMFGLDW